MMSTRDTSIGSARRWLESVTFTMLSPLLGLVVSRADPFLIRADFPWLVLVPLLVGTQHGLWPAIVSAGLLGARVYGQAMLGHSVTTEMLSWVAGCLVVGAIAGYTRDRSERGKRALIQHQQKLSEQFHEARQARHVVEVWPAHSAQPSRSQHESSLTTSGAASEPVMSSRNVTAIGFNRRAADRRARS